MITALIRISFQIGLVSTETQITLNAHFFSKLFDIVESSLFCIIRFIRCIGVIGTIEISGTRYPSEITNLYLFVVISRQLSPLVQG